MPFLMTVTGVMSLKQGQIKPVRIWEQSGLRHRRFLMLPRPRLMRCFKMPRRR